MRTFHIPEFVLTQVRPKSCDKEPCSQYIQAKKDVLYCYTKILVQDLYLLTYLRPDYERKNGSVILALDFKVVDVVQFF